MAKKLKLTIELIPSTTFYTNVRSKLGHTLWQAIRNLMLEKAGYKCEVCDKPNSKTTLHVHEEWRYDFNSRKQILTGLKVLCEECHSVKHIGKAKIDGKFNSAFNHFCKVNGLTKNEATTIISNAFIMWNKISKINWDVDISWLKQNFVRIDYEQYKV